MATEVSPATGGVLFLIGATWLATAVSPLVGVMVAKTKADTDAFLTALGFIWCGPITIALVGLGASWLKSMLYIFNSLRGK